MPMLRAYGGSRSTRRSPKRISPASTAAKPAISRSSVVLPQPDGPSSVNSSPSAISSEMRSTAVVLAKRLVTSLSAIFNCVEGGPSTVPPRTPLFAWRPTPSPSPSNSPIRVAPDTVGVALLWLLPGGLDVGAEFGLERFGALGGDGLVVDVRELAVEVGAHATGELHGHLRRGAGRALHLVLRRDGEEPALHEDLLPALGQQELDERARRPGVARAGQDGHRLRRDEGVLRRHELEIEARELLLEGHVRRHGEARRVLPLRDDRRHVAAARGEMPGIGGELFEPIPALVLAVHREDHFVRRVRRRRARGRALRDLALELGLQQIVPVLRLGDAEAVDL